MSFKHKWVYIAFILVLLPVTAYSQASLYRLSTAETSFGIGIIRQGMGIITSRDTTIIGGNLDYRIENNLKLSFQAGVGLTDAVDVPPSPIGGIGIVHIEPLGETGLEYFGGGDFGAAFFRAVRESTNQVLERSRLLRLSGTIGILKRLETENELEINPFFALSYSRFWETSEVNAEFAEELEGLVFKKSADYGDLAGEVGVEIELSSMTTGLVAFKFSFERSDAAFRIGLNFR